MATIKELFYRNYKRDGFLVEIPGYPVIAKMTFAGYDVKDYREMSCEYYLVENEGRELLLRRCDYQGKNISCYSEAEEFYFWWMKTLHYYDTGGRNVSLLGPRDKKKDFYFRKFSFSRESNGFKCEDATFNLFKNYVLVTSRVLVSLHRDNQSFVVRLKPDKDLIERIRMIPSDFCFYDEGRDEWIVHFFKSVELRELISLA